MEYLNVIDKCLNFSLKGSTNPEINDEITLDYFWTEIGLRHWTTTDVAVFMA